MELPRQADDRHHRHAGLHDHRRPVDRLLPVFREARCRLGLGQQVVEAVVQAPGDEHADGDERQQLDQRLEGHRHDHAAVVLGGVQVAGAEQDGEQGEDQRHDQRRVLGAQAVGAGIGAGQQVDAEDYPLELQGDVGQHADQADQGHDDGQRARLAVARGDEVGDRGDVFLLADQDHLGQHLRHEQQQQQRAEVDGHERPQLSGRLADRAEKGPAGAVHRQGQAVHPGAQARAGHAGGLATVAVEGDGKQDGHVGQGDRGDQPAGQRHANSGVSGSAEFGSKVLRRQALATKVVEAWQRLCAAGCRRGGEGGRRARRGGRGRRASRRTPAGAYWASKAWPLTPLLSGPIRYR
ncbi:hypothetical protein D3C75_738790 [compost metagenome]